MGGMSDPSPALGSIPVAAEVEAPNERFSVDPCPTPFAHAIFPRSYEEDGPTSRELLLDDRVERLLRENLELMKERAALRSIHQQRIDRCNELLEVTRQGRAIVRTFLAERDACEKDPSRMAPLDFENDLRAWAAKAL